MHVDENDILQPKFGVLICPVLSNSASKVFQSVMFSPRLVKNKFLSFRNIWFNSTFCVSGCKPPQTSSVSLRHSRGVNSQTGPHLESQIRDASSVPAVYTNCRTVHQSQNASLAVSDTHLLNPENFRFTFRSCLRNSWTCSVLLVSRARECVAFSCLRYL
jgi:hypothetical protein